MSLKVAIRTDASAIIGHGHVVRCLTLANQLSRCGFKCEFFCEELPDNLLQRIVGQGHSVALASEDDLDLSCELVAFDPDWLITDSYVLDEELEGTWKRQIPGLKVLAIDDLANRRHDCDVLLDMTAQRSTEDYKQLVPEGAEFCLGLEFALLDDGYAKAREKAMDRRGTTSDPKEILVTLGGGDVSQELAIIVESLGVVAQSFDFSITVIGDSEGVDFGSIGDDLRLVPYSEDMTSELLNADICVGAAGGTSWERCCLGLPTVVVQIADNQKDNFMFLRSSGAALASNLNADEIAAQLMKLITDVKLYRKVSKAAFDACDGLGAKRVASKVIAQSLQVRKVTMDDAKFIYAARYSKDAAQYYKSNIVPTFDSHCEWMLQALADENRELLIYELNGEPVAHVRLDEGLHISIYVSPEFLGKGIGTAVLKSSQEHKFSKLIAEVHDENLASIRMFENAGFVKFGNEQSGFWQYEWTNSG